MAKAEEILEYEIGKGQAENFFLVRNASGRILYKYNIQATEFEYIPLEDRWHTVNHPEKYIRVLSLTLHQLDDTSLQVGIIINKDLVFPQLISKVTWLTLLVANGLGLLIAWILANFLTKPIRLLSESLNQNAQIENGHFSVEMVSDQQLNPDPNSRDEFDQLILSINQLIKRVNHGFRISRLWTYQMSHEIKTPLSIIASIVQQNTNALSSVTAESIQLQIFKISETVNAFLSWAEAQNIRPSVSHVIRISRLVNDVIHKVQLKVDVQIEPQIENDFIVGINYNQMEQVLTNLVVNAFNHGQKNTPIQILCRSNSVTVVNRGAPFPQKIMDHLGQPFNKGDSKEDNTLFKGTGLGLAYVSTVCQTNEYPLHISHHDGLTSVSIDLTTALSRSVIPAKS
jgi:two-component system sensor histidine kinase QseC